MRAGLRLLALVMVLAAAAAPAAAAAAPLATVRLPAYAAVAGPDILLGDIAVIEADDGELAQKLARLSVGRAAVPGQSRDVTEATIRVRMRQQSLPEKEIVIESEKGSVTVATLAQTVSGAALVGVAEAAILADGVPTGAGVDPVWSLAEIVMTCPNPGAVTVADGELELSASRIIGSPPGPVVVSVSVVVAGVVNRTVMVRCDTVVAADVLVTTTSVQRYDVLGEGNVAVERREFTTLPRQLLTPDTLFGAEAFGWRATRPIQPGTVLTQSMVETVPVVLKGAPVQIVAAGAHVVVAAPGEALEDGRLGDIIQVRNVTSGQIIRARVSAADRVEAVY